MGEQETGGRGIVSVSVAGSARRVQEMSQGSGSPLRAAEGRCTLTAMAGVY